MHYGISGASHAILYVYPLLVLHGIIGISHCRRVKVSTTIVHTESHIYMYKNDSFLVLEHIL